MIYRYKTQQINGNNYVTEVQLVEVKKRTLQNNEMPFGLASGTMLLDENGKLQIVFADNPQYDPGVKASIENPPYLIEKIAQELTPQEKNSRKLKTLEEKVLRHMSFVDLVGAVIDFKNGDSAKLDEIEKLVKEQDK